MNTPESSGREPMFNLPGAVLALLAIILAIHAGQAFVFDPGNRYDLNLWFAFIPARLSFPGEIPGGYVPLIWTPFTHALLHANWMHVLLNAAWLAIFGTPVARRYGAVRFFLVFAVTSAVGALAFALFYTHSGAFLVGASGGISGLTGVAVRFIFQPVIIKRDPETGEPVVLGRKLASLREVFANSRARGLTLVWLALNALAPILPLVSGMEADIAWQAHIGGFLAGFLFAPLLEMRRWK